VAKPGIAADVAAPFFLKGYHTRAVLIDELPTRAPLKMKVHTSSGEMRTSPQAIYLTTCAKDDISGDWREKTFESQTHLLYNRRVSRNSLGVDLWRASCWQPCGARLVGI
jgi:hypothetical protein